MTTTCGSPNAATSQLLDALLKKLADDGHDVHHRLESRYPVHAPMTLGVRVGNRQEYKALDRGWALDLSRHGLAILLEHEIPVNMEIFINLESLTQQPCIMLVRVVYSQQLLPSAHRIGAAFVLE